MKDFLLGLFLTPTLVTWMREHPPKGFFDWLDRFWLVGVCLFFWGSLFKHTFTN